MNLCDCYVTEVVGSPYEQYGKWWVEVKYDSWGNISQSTRMFNTLEEALALKVGYHFLA